MRARKRKKKRSLLARLFGRNPAKKLRLAKWYPSSSVEAIRRERTSKRRGKKGARVIPLERWIGR